MTRRRAAGALVASPVLVGAVTVLISVIAVFIAYGSNQGLPFVPTYDLKADLPNGAKLVEGNEVRVGGFRVGAVDKITAVRTGRRGKERSVARVDLKLDKTVEPLPADSAVTVRPRSALGLKYVELVPGRSREELAPGDTIRLSSGPAGRRPPLELEDALATFDAEMRNNSRVALEGFGSGLAGRGASVNEAIGSLRPFLRHLQPVMENLSDPETELDGLFRGLGRAAAEAAPVAEVQGQLFANMADSFAAISRSPEALRETIVEGPPTMAVAVRSFRVQRPFLADFADLSRRLRPAARELPRSLPPLNSALRVGTPVLRRSVDLNDGLRTLFAELDELGENPNTLLALQDLDVGIDALRPGIEFVAPYQTVCNHFVYFFNPLGEHISQRTGGGTVERILLKQANRNQKNALTARTAARPVDVAADQNPQQPGSNPPATLHNQYTGPAVDDQGRADCQTGQNGYPDRYAPGSRYGPTEEGGRRVTLGGNTPGNRGGTYKAQELGIDDVGDVP